MAGTREDHQRYAVQIAVFATVLYAALVIAGFGLISLVLERDVVARGGLGPLIGPAMTATSVLLVLIALVAVAMRVPQERTRVSLPVALVIGFGAYLFFGVAYGVLAGARSGSALGIVVALGAQIVSPFAVVAGALAVLVSLLFLIVVSAHREGGRPRWPWESRDEP